MSWTDPHGVTHKSNKWSVLKAECGAKVTDYVKRAPPEQPITCFWCVAGAWWDRDAEVMMRLFDGGFISRSTLVKLP